MPSLLAPSVRTRLIAGTSVVAIAAASIVTFDPQPAFAAPSTVTQTFSYTGTVQNFTVPSGVTALTVTLQGGQGGNGGADATPAPALGTYFGVVTGTIAVTPGDVLQVAVGSGGATGRSSSNSTAPTAFGGTNPLSGYDGGNGGQAGTRGSSGQGGAGGAASVLVVDGQDIVAAGGGGNGGSGQFAPTRGRNADGTFVARTDVTSTNGQVGINAAVACAQSTCSNDDGGGSGGGGAGAQGGAQGRIEFGAGSSNEWFGYGGSVGENSVATFTSLLTSYGYAAQNSGNGSITISYETGSPGAPTAVQGSPGVNLVNLSWAAPAATGGAAISDYAVRYSSDNGANWSAPVLTGSTARSTVVTGLTNDTAYVFQVAAISSLGTGDYSPASAPITPRGLPSAPTITAVEPRDGALALAVTPPASGATATGYEYRIDGGSWLPASGASSPIAIPGLVNGVTYSVELRATSIVGSGAASAPATGTPFAVPGAPTIDGASATRAEITLSVTPGFNGGTPITDYEVQLNGAEWTPVGTSITPLRLTGLADGTSYEVTVRAVNSAGAGAASAPITIATPGVPGPLANVTGAAGDSRAIVNFTTGGNGGSAITRVEYSLDGSSWTPTTTTGPVTISGLTNGTPELVRLRSVNAIGAGPISSVVVTPATVPSAPTIIEGSVAGLDGALEVSFTAPPSDGGEPITGYEYSTDAGVTWQPRADGGSVASPLTITTQSSDGSTPLENGETYYVQLRALNAAGAGPASSVAPGVPVQAASAPAITAVTSQPSSVAVSFTPGSNGGSAVIRYEYSINGGGTWTSTGSLSTEFTIGGLTDGQPVSVRVRAVTAVGDGSPSAAVSGTPASAPTAPTLTSVVRGDRSLTVTVAPADNGGSPITRWEYSTDGGATWATAPGAGPSHVLIAPSADLGARLQNGQGYSVQVRGVNVVGASAASLPLYSAPATSPPAPSVSATAGDSSVTVAFAFADDGGSPLTRIEYSVDGGATWIDSSTVVGPIVLTGLTNGQPVSVSVRGVNAIGNGTPSGPATATPRTIPDAPTDVVAVSNTASADVSWTPPSFTGGADITSYLATAYESVSSTTPVATCTSDSTNCSIPGLANGVTYYVSVVASNAAGDSVASTPRVAVTPLQRPAAPTLSSLTSGDRALSAAFSAGAVGGGTFLRYEYSVDSGSNWFALTSASNPATITNLTNGTSYTVRLRAVTTAGPSPASNSLTGTPFGFPSAPTSIEADARNGSIVVSWAPANANGGTILNYTATAFTAASGGSTVTTCTATTLSCTLTGLSNGTTYYVSVQTQNTVSMYSVRSDRVAATPSLLPSAPRSVTATAGDALVSLSWTPPMGQGASALTGYSVLCSMNGASFTSCGSTTGTTFDVTGLQNGASYRFQIVANNSSGAGPASASTSPVTPLAPGIVPTFDSTVATATGFTVRITNFDAAADYVMTAPSGVTATRSGELITVSGLTPGASASIGVSVSTPTSLPASASVSGAALLAGVVPALSLATPINGGFQFTITNLDPDATYVIEVADATVSRSGAIVTVTGLVTGGSAEALVTVQKSGYTTVSATRTGSALVEGVAPTFGPVTSTADGFTVEITNYDSSALYSLSIGDEFLTLAAPTVTRAGSLLTITGLSPAASATVTVTAQAPSALPASSDVTGTALAAGVTPEWEAPEPMIGGFRVVVANFDPEERYVLSVTAGTALMVGDTIYVTGLADGELAELTMTAQRDGYADRSATVTGAALGTPVAPEWDAPEPMSGGFRVVIQNFDPDARYILSVTRGTALMVGDTIYVMGLADGEVAELTMTLQRDGYADVSVTVTGQALSGNGGGGDGGGNGGGDNGTVGNAEPVPADVADRSADLAHTGASSTTLRDGLAGGALLFLLGALAIAVSRRSWNRARTSRRFDGR
ncbi:fibronectin type III domain protein [Microcella putealis]|uniref:Fibronectin type III domain protein n=1 Tax=Microcella putealis TaxID=337005 RepID=A0A4Q7LNL4_9MICO|nr:fibronectin type III domain-containing protein [Microcella putealis]RZS56194.1 fibronectin type III domain protein [Microcella putealis]TQM23375.1 fibronectin type III domain protein [Microcella putealis]